MQQPQQQKGDGRNSFPAFNITNSTIHQQSQNIHNYSYGPLSAQNLMFLPANVNQFPIAVQPPANLPGQKISSQKNDEESRTKYHKDRQFEQQRHKLQAVGQTVPGGRQFAQSQRDAMIAQIIGPLPGARHSDSVTHQPPVSMPAQESLTQSNNRTLNTNKNYNSSTSSVQLTPQDLERMMQRYYDFTTDPKAQGFIKPSHTLSNITTAPVTTVSTHTFTSDPNAAQWSYSKTTNLEGVFVLPSNLPQPVSTHAYYPTTQVQNNFPTWKPFPPWLTDLAKIPKEYVKYFHSCIPPNRFEEIPDTGLVYILLRASGLSNDALGAIWSLVNRTQPGQLTKIEFFAALALVAFTQKFNKIPTLDALDEMKIAMVPSFGAKIESILNSHVSSFPSQTFPNQIVDATSVNPPPLTPLAKKDDEFSDFTDFQAASTSETFVNDDTVHVQSDENRTANDLLTSTPDIFNLVIDGNKTTRSVSQQIIHEKEDPYDALRKLTDSPIVPIDGSSTKPAPALPNSVSENSFVFHKMNELHTTYKLDHVPREGAEKFVSEFDRSTTKTAHSTDATRFINGPQPIVDNAATNVSQDSSSSAVFNELDNDNNIIKYAFGQTSFDSPDSCSLHSKEPSLHSLDLKSVLTIDSNEEIKEIDNDTVQQQLPKNNVHHTNGNGLTMSTTLFDRYAAVRETRPTSAEEKLIEAWTKILEICLQLLQQACDHFSKTSTSEVCKEIINCERGSNYLKSLVEVFRVARRLKISLKTNTFQTEHIIILLDDIETAWENLCTYFSFTDLLIKQSDLICKNLSTKQENNVEQQDVCGICLLNVNCVEKKCDESRELSSKVINYSGRRYHSQCANLWVNCVESLLPALEVPNLL